MDQVDEPAWLAASREARQAEIERARVEHDTKEAFKPEVIRQEPTRRRARASQRAGRYGRPHTSESRKRIGASLFDVAWRGVDLAARLALCRARVLRGWSLRAAAFECGVSPTAFARAENGEAITPETRRRIVAVFGPEVFPDE